MAKLTDFRTAAYFAAKRRKHPITFHAMPGPGDLYDPRSPECDPTDDDFEQFLEEEAQRALEDEYNSHCEPTPGPED